jgi:hypothetical protein
MARASPAITFHNHTSNDAIIRRV